MTRSPPDDRTGIPTRVALVADIGGTNARFALVDDSVATTAATGPTPVPAPRHARSLPVADHATLGQAVQAYLDAVYAGQGAAAGWPRPQRAAFAVATAITGDQVRLTNSPWSFSTDALRQRLQLDELFLLNDFTALAWSLLSLPTDQIHPVGGGRALDDAPRGLIGPGTGLGVSGLIPVPGGGWAALQCEGGHTSLSPADPREAAILMQTWREFPHVSFERLVCGSGLPLLYRMVARVDGLTPPSVNASAKEIGPTPAEISRAALDGEPLALATMSTFCAMLGTAAANLALTLGARGGIYIGGGIVPKLGAWFETSPFRTRFESKGRFSDWLREVPTYVIDPRDDDPALAGAAQALRERRGAR